MIDPALDTLCLGLLLTGSTGMGRILARAGGWTLGSGWYDLVLWSALGLAALAVMMLLLGLSHLYYASILRVIGAAWLVGGCIGLARGVPARSRLRSALSSVELPRYQLAVLALAVLALAFSLLRATTPPHGATDPLAYQLALPKIYLAKHHISFERTINGALYPAYANLLYVMAIALRGGGLAQAVHWLFGLLTCVAVVAMGCRYCSLRAGIWGAILLSFTPVLVFYSALGYIDVGLCFFQVIVVWTLFEWMDRGGTRNLLLLGLMLGVSMGIKTPAAVLLPLAAAAVAWRARRDGAASCLGQVALLSLSALAVAGPWYVRSYLHAGNPIWPMANGLFGGLAFGHEHFLPAFVQQAVEPAEHGPLDRAWLMAQAAVVRVATKITALWMWTWEPKSLQQFVGCYWVALLPGLALVRWTRPVRRVAAFCAVFYVTTILVLGANPRYSLVLFPFLALLCGHVIDEIVRDRSRWLAYAVVACVLASAAGNTVWSYWLAQPTLAYVTGELPRDRFLQAAEPTFPVLDHASRKLPAEATVLLQGVVKGYYCDRAYLWDHPYQKVLVYSDYDDDIDRLAAGMRELGITHVVRAIQVPPGRLAMGYPQYFTDPFHERFRHKYLRLLFNDRRYALFEVSYDRGPSGA